MIEKFSVSKAVEAKGMPRKPRIELRDDDRPNAPRCPNCGSYKAIYQADRQVCAECGRE